MHAAGFISLIIFGFFEFLRLTVEELQALQAKGLIFLIIFGFFVENHLLANTKSSFYDLQFESYNLCRQQTLFFSLFSVSLLKNTKSSFHNLWFKSSMSDSQLWSYHPLQG